MKKLYLFIVSCFLLNLQTKAIESITFNTNIIDKSGVGHQTPKSPMQPPTVYIEDYTLSFAVGHPEYVLQITDEDGDVVYTTTVFSTDTQVVLPTYLSGNYEIQLTMGNWLFTGYINLS